MAASLATRRLTEAHRLAQTRLGVATVAQLRRAWRILNPDDVDGTFDLWLAAAAPIVASQHEGSATLAARYLETFKRMSLGDAATIRPAPVELDRSALATSLLVTGPLSIKRAMTHGVPVARALKTAEAASSAAGMRHALDGGRQTIMATLRADPRARGWRRVASGGACKFCVSLEGKFHRAETADFPAHDGCACSQEPVFD